VLKRIVSFEPGNEHPVGVHKAGEGATSKARQVGRHLTDMRHGPASGGDEGADEAEEFQKAKPLTFNGRARC